MNKDTVQGTIDEVVGSAKQKTGKLIGNPSLQVKGLAQRTKGKLENAVGKIEDSANDADRESNAHRTTRSE